MKKINYKNVGIVAVIIFLINLVLYYGLFILCNEFMYRVNYDLKEQYNFVYIFEIVALLVPLFISILYFVFRNKLKEKFNSSNIGHTLLVFCVLCLIVGVVLDLAVGLLLKNNVIAYCSPLIEEDILIGCNLRGIEYILMMILIFLPLFIVPVFELLIFIHKKITKKVKLDFIDILIILLVFIIICFIIWLIYYTFMF